MNLEQHIKEFVETFSKIKYTHKKINEPTCDPSTSYPYVTFVVASNPTYIAKLVPASINTK